MYTVNLHPDFRDESFRAARLSDRLNTTIGFLGGFLERNWSAIKYVFFIVPLAFLIFLFSVPGLLLVWLLFRWVNDGLRKSLAREIKGALLTASSYKDAKRRLVEIKASLARIENLDKRINETSVLFKPLFKRELNKSKQIILKYITDSEAAMNDLNKPVLKDFDSYTIKESKLWERRSEAYEYLF